MAVEDGAVLGVLLGILSQQSISCNIIQDVPSLLHLYESLRKSRTTLNVQGAVANQKMFHLPDGAEQEVRDFALSSVDWETGRECHWADIRYQKRRWGGMR